MTDISVLIPARNEAFLNPTIQDILLHAESDFEIIVVLDGTWPTEPIPQHERVTVLYYPESIGQRAACNRAATIARGKYVLKCDAHCAFDQGFDVKLMADMKDDWTVVPVMKNLHVFDWVCPDGHRRYQGPSGDCKECGEHTTKDIVWISKNNPQSTSYCFDSELHFQYFGDFKKRPEGKGDITETMSLQGSCFMLTREKYFELNICDESWGSWGNQGTEVACKTWLSGGRCVVNHNTWYAHLFRTQGNDFGFPYPISGEQVDHARKCSRDLFLNNKWEKQVRPLSWLIDKFKPVPFWHGESGKDALARVTEAGASFTTTQTLAFKTTSLSKGNIGSEKMSELAMGLPGSPGMLLDSSWARENILTLSYESEMSGIATGSIPTNVVNNSVLHTSENSTIDNNIHKPMDEMFITMPNGKNSVASALEWALPVPAASYGVNNDSGAESDDLIGSENRVIISDSHSIPPSKVLSRLESERVAYRSDSIVLRSTGIVYYSDNRLNSNIMRACQEQLVKASRGYRIISVTLEPTNFGRNIVLPLERGYLTLFRQILAGLEELDTDVVFFAEHDILYHPSHFEFLPPDRSKIYYNTNIWHWKYGTDKFLYYTAKRTSQLCAYRDVLIEHYSKRVELVLKNGFTRSMGFEPGSHHRAERVDDLQSDVWESDYPNIDIKHGNNLTAARWKQSEFRDQRNCQNWKEADHVSAWDDKLRRLVDGN